MTITVAAVLQWPSAPLTKYFVMRALERTINHSVTDQVDLEDRTGKPTLQWSTYDVIDHERTLMNRETVLSSSFTIRKALIRKHFLHRCITSYTTKHPESPLISCIPKTWDIDISFADELDNSGPLWADELYDLAVGFEAQPKKWYILKPGMADRGMGIRLFNDKASLQRIFEQFEEESDADEAEEDTKVVTSQLRHFVIQEYLGDALLLDPGEQINSTDSSLQSKGSLRGYKFHLRAYCVALGSLQIFLYEHVLALFSSEPYDPPSCGVESQTLDLRPHLTNTCLQGNPEDVNVLLLRELVGSTLLNPALDDSDPGNHVFTDEDLDSVMAQMSVVLAETFTAALQTPVHFQALPNAFELYGVDFLVCYEKEKMQADAKDRFSVKLLEFNAEPAIEMTGERLRWILEDLFEAMSRTCVAPFFSIDIDETVERNGEKRRLLRKCLDINLHR